MKDRLRVVLAAGFALWPASQCLAAPGKKLVRKGSGWIAHAGCSVITWKEGFEAARQPIFDVSVQTNLYYGGDWWLFSEWGNLLRPDSSNKESEICVKIRSSETCRRIPEDNEPPLLMPRARATVTH